MSHLRSWLIASVTTAASLATSAAAQQVKPRLALFPVAFYGKGANSLERGDSQVAVMTDSILRAELEHSGSFQLVDSARLARSYLQATTGGKECVTLECRSGVSRQAGATLMTTSK